MPLGEHEGQELVSTTMMTTTVTTMTMTTATLLYRLPLATLWLWLLVLVESLANQSLPRSLLEDRLNKPWQPVPSGLASPAQALSQLRDVAVPAALAMGFLSGAALPTALVMVAVWLYNNLDGGQAAPLLRHAPPEARPS